MSIKLLMKTGDITVYFTYSDFLFTVKYIVTDKFLEGDILLNK